MIVKVTILIALEFVEVMMVLMNVVYVEDQVLDMI